MPNTDVITEKVYCSGCDRGSDYALWANQNNMNNPMWLVWVMALRWMGFNGDGYGCGQNPQLAAMQNQISDNQSFNNLMTQLTQNQNLMQDFANRTNTNIDFVRQSLCALNAAVQNVEGTTKFSAERIINAANRGDTEIIMALKDCCCQNKELVQRMGYENQLGQKDLLFHLQQGHNDLGFKMQAGFDRTNTGLERGFSTIAYESQRQTCDIVNAVNAAQQRTADLLNSHWKDELSKENLILRNRIDNYEQNDKIVDRIAQRFGDSFGFGCAR